MLTFFSEQCICALFMDPQISFFINFFIKNGSHSTIYTFKNYFATVISAISLQFQQNKSYPNRPLIKRTVICPFYEFKTHGPTINEKNKEKKSNRRPNKWTDKINLHKKRTFLMIKGIIVISKGGPYQRTWFDWISLSTLCFFGKGLILTFVRDFTLQWGQPSPL